MARVSFGMPEIRSASALFAVLLVVVSVLVAVLGGLAPWVVLVPELIVSKFYLWQLVTYAFVETSPMGVIFGALIIFQIGRMLEGRWGTKKFVAFALGISAAAGVCTTVLSLLVPSLVAMAYPGGTVVTGSLWVAYGLLVGRGQTNFWGIGITGNMLALIGAGFVFLNAAFAGLHSVIPEAFALSFTFLLVRGYVPTNLWMRFRGWQLERDLKKRASHLRSVDGGRRNTGGGSDKFLQ